MSSNPTNASQVVTFRPDGSCPRWLGAYANINSLKYSYVMPGGPDQMSCNLTQPSQWRNDALNPGRIVKIFRGTSCVWDGELDEPSADSEWSITAHGAGTYGTQFLATWNATYDLNSPINLAITRGLRWVNPGIASGWLGAQPDYYSDTVADWLNDLTLQAGYIWYVGAGNVLSVGLPPSTVNRLIVCTNPVSRTVAADVNRVFMKYCASDDGEGDQTYAWALAQNNTDITNHQPYEELVDASSAPVMSASAANGYASNILSQYQGAAFTNPITVRYGQLMTPGGQPIDLGTDQAGTYARLIVTDEGYGGEVIPGPVTFVVGQYEYDDDSQTAQITPWQSYRNDFSSLITVAVPGLRQ